MVNTYEPYPINLQLHLSLLSLANFHGSKQHTNLMAGHRCPIIHQLNPKARVDIEMDIEGDQSGVDCLNTLYTLSCSKLVQSLWLRFVWDNRIPAIRFICTWKLTLGASRVNPLWILYLYTLTLVMTIFSKPTHNFNNSEARSIYQSIDLSIYLPILT